MIRAGRSGLGRLAGLLPGRFPQRRRHAGPGLGRKCPAEPRRHVAADQRGLDRDRAGAAEGIDQRPLGPPDAQEDQRRRQGFLQRRLARQRPVAPLVQPRTAGVDGQHGLVVEQGHFDGVFRARLREPLDPIGRLEPLDDRLLHDFLAGRHAGKLRFDRPARHGELGLDGKPVFPRQGPGAIEKLAEIAGFKGVQSHQDPVGRPQPEVRAADIGLIAGKQHPPGLDDFRLVAQRLEFPRDDGLQSERAGGDQIELGGR